jgi:hypothetical protein
MLTLLAILVTALGAGGCSTLHDVPADPQALTLQGDWALADNSQQTAISQLDTLIAKQREKQRRQRRERFGDDLPPPGLGGGPEDLAFNAQEMKERRDILVQFLTPPQHLAVQQGDATLVFKADQQPARVLEPGHTLTRFDESGTAVVNTGWDGKAFVIRTEFTDGSSRVERYTPDAKAGTMVVLRTLKESSLGKLELTSTYRHAP